MKKIINFINMMFSFEFIEGQISHFFPFFYSKEIFAYFSKRDDFDLNIIISFLEKFPERFFDDSSLRVRFNLKWKTFDEHLLCQGLSFSLKEVCSSTRRNNLNNFKTFLVKLNKREIDFISLSLYLTHIMYIQLREYRIFLNRYKRMAEMNSVGKQKEILQLKTQCYKKAIEEHISLMKNSDMLEILELNKKVSKYISTLE